MNETSFRHGYIEVNIEILSKDSNEEIDIQNVYLQLQGRNVVMIESKSYYEAYSHVLK